MTSQVQYHFHNVSARDLLVSGEPKWNGWQRVPTIYYLNFFQAFFFLFWFWVFLKCSHFSRNYCKGKNEQNIGKQQHGIISLAGLRHPGLQVLLLSVPETSITTGQPPPENPTPVYKLFSLIHPTVYSIGISFAGAGSQHWAGSEQLGC